MLFYGIEASDPETLRKRRKSFAKHFDQIARDIAHAQSCGIFVRGGFIVGHEQDTEDSFERHLQFLKSVHPMNCTLASSHRSLARRSSRSEARGPPPRRRLEEVRLRAPILKIDIEPDRLVELRDWLYREYYSSREWHSHLDFRIARRPEELQTINRYRGFIEGRIALVGAFAAANGS